MDMIPFRASRERSSRIHVWPVSAFELTGNNPRTDLHRLLVKCFVTVDPLCVDWCDVVFLPQLRAHRPFHTRQTHADTSASFRVLPAKACQGYSFRVKSSKHLMTSSSSPAFTHSPTSPVFPNFGINHLVLLHRFSDILLGLRLHLVDLRPIFHCW